MDSIQSSVKDSIALDAAYLNRGVPAMIDSLAEEAKAEVERAQQRASDDLSAAAREPA